MESRPRFVHRASLFVLGLMSAAVMGCVGGARDSAGDADAGDQGWTNVSNWQVDATLAGRGGAGGALAQWSFAARPDGALDASAPRVVAIPAPNEQTYNLFWSREAQLSDVRLSVRVQARSGAVDQGGGPIWRVQDRDNYYICRVNPLESNFRLYKVVDGVRAQLCSIQMEMPGARSAEPGAWHTIEVTHVGDQIVCTLDGVSRLEARDSAITEPGGVGVWTKADAVTWFDGFAAARATASD